MDLLMRAFNEIADLRRYVSAPERLAKFEPSRLGVAYDLQSPLAGFWLSEHLEDYGLAASSWKDCSTINLVLRPQPTVKPVEREGNLDRSVVSMKEWADKKATRKVWTTVEPLATHGTLQ